MFDILKEWRKEYMSHSSDFNYKKWCDRKDIVRIENIFINYFGEDFFTKIRKGNEIHLVHSLFMQYSKPALTSLFEIAHLLEYLKTLNPEIQRIFKSHCKKPRQFEASLFEIYTYRILDGNGVQNEKATHSGNQILEGECLLNSKQFLFECRKSYSVMSSKLKDQEDMSALLHTYLDKMKNAYDFIGYIFIKKYSGAAKEELKKILKCYFSQEKHRAEVDLDHVRFETKLYNESNLLEYNSKVNVDLIKFRCFFEDIKTCSYAREILLGVSSLQSEINKKIIKTIDKKRYQHKNSKFENRIIFIDCEVQPNNKFPLMMDESMLESKKINDHLGSKNTKDIVVIFMRNYGQDTPFKRTYVFGKDDLKTEKQILKKLKSHFAYICRNDGTVSYRSPF